MSAIQGAGFGVSSTESTTEAVGEAVSKAMESLGGSSSDAKPALAFCSATVKRDIEEVRQAFVEKLPNGTPIHGITSSGAILTPGGGAVAGSVACLLLTTNDEGAFSTAFDKEDGAKAAEALKAKMSAPQAIFMGATPGAEEGVLETLEKVFPGVPVFGGTAADDELKGDWRVFCGEQEEAASSATGVSLVGVGASVSFGASMLGPYTSTAKTCQATKTEGRRVFEIDGRPAADWVYEWLGDSVKEQYENGGLVLPQTAQKPIAIQVKEGGDELVTAHCAAFSGKEQDPTYVDFFAPVPEGATLTVMDSGDGPSTGYASALSQAYDTAASGVGTDHPKAGLLVFCGGMAIAVGDNLDAGLSSADFGSKTKNLPVLGMTCFGEQACLTESKKNAQRNLSVGMVLFG